DQLTTLQAILSQEDDPNLTYARSVSYAFTWNVLSTSDVPVSSLSVMENSRRGKLSPNEGSPTALWMHKSYQARGYPARW
ncbi:hypothetical protein M9458_045178, partial [Cirrhinus mrigala]